MCSLTKPNAETRITCFVCPKRAKITIMYMQMAEKNFKYMETTYLIDFVEMISVFRQLHYVLNTTYNNIMLINSSHKIGCCTDVLEIMKI